MATKTKTSKLAGTDNTRTNTDAVFAGTDFNAKAKEEAKNVPTAPISIIHLHSMPPVQTQDMSTDRLHAILRSAEGGQWQDYLSVLRDVTAGDASIQPDWMQRKSRLLGKPWALTAEDKKDKLALGNVEFVQANLKGCRDFLSGRAHLLDSTIFPVAVVEKIFARAGSGWRLARLVPVPHDLLDYRNGYLQIRTTTPEGVPDGGVMDLDPVRYIVHRGHLLRGLPDCWGGPGRALLFFWFLAAAGRNWWARGLERDSAPFLLGKFDPARPEDEWAMARAFADAQQRFGLVVSNNTDVQVFKDLASGSAASHESWQKFCLGMCSRIVVGQTQTTMAQAQGLGSGQANVGDDVLTNIVAFDDMLLAETLQEQLFIPLLQMNGRSGPPPVISHGVVSDNLMERAKLFGELKKAGISLKPEAAESISEALGVPVEIGGGAGAGAGGEPDEGDAGLPGPPKAGKTAREKLSVPAEVDLRLTGAAAASLAQGFRGSLAPVRRLIEESTGPEDLERRIVAFYSDWPAGRVAALVQEALTAFGCNAAVAFPR